MQCIAEGVTATLYSVHTLTLSQHVVSPLCPSLTSILPVSDCQTVCLFVDRLRRLATPPAIREEQDRANTHSTAVEMVMVCFPGHRVCRHRCVWPWYRLWYAVLADNSQFRHARNPPGSCRALPLVAPSQSTFVSDGRRPAC